MKRAILILLCLLIPSMVGAAGKASAGAAEAYQAAQKLYVERMQTRYLGALADQMEEIKRAEMELDGAQKRLKDLVEMGMEEWWVKEYLATELW